MREPHQPERRLWPRAEVVGTAIALANGRYVGTYVLADLSASGALLLGEAQISVGTELRLLLQLQGRSRRFALVASLVRHEARGSQSGFAVKFSKVPAHLQDALQAAACDYLATPPVRNLVLTIHPDGERAAWLQRDLVELGYESVVVHSALDAIAWLHPLGRCAAIVVAAELHASIEGIALLEFLSKGHPDVRRVLVSGPNAETAQHEALANGSVHALLEAPWTRESLRSAVARFRDEGDCGSVGSGKGIRAT